MSSVETSWSAEPSAAAKACGCEPDAAAAEAESSRSLFELVVGSLSSRWARQLVARTVRAAASAPARGRKSGLLLGVVHWALRSLFRKRPHDEADADAIAERSNADTGHTGRDPDAEKAEGYSHTNTSTSTHIARERQQPRFDLFCNAASSSTFDLHAILAFALLQIGIIA